MEFGVRCVMIFGIIGMFRLFVLCSVLVLGKYSKNLIIVIVGICNDFKIYLIKVIDDCIGI